MISTGKNLRLHVLNASGKFNRCEEKIYKVTKTILKIIDTKIPIFDVDILFYDNPFATIKGRGIGGRSLEAHTIFIPLDLKFKDLDGVINTEVPRTLAHELHHIVRYREVGRRKTLLDGLVAEGLAGHFEIELFGGKPQRWYQAVKKKDFKRLFRLYEKNYFEPIDHSKWFFGMGDKDIPKWTGYTLGYEIVGKYLRRNPVKKASNLYNATSSDFL